MLMKIGGRIALFAAGLCVMTGTVCAELYLAHRNHVPGRYGRNLEFRVSALNTENFDQFSRAPDGFDVFSGSLAREIAESGVAPAGFEWLPLSNFDLGATGGVEPRGITRVINGREFLLVADRPEMVLTHTANAPAWGVKSVQITASYKYGPVVKAVEIKLDDTGGGLLQQFTQKYVRHSIAVILDGQVIANFGLLSPISKDVLGLRFPAGGEVEAERLRDTLMQ
ncbi:MAG: hypothetical protein WAL45_09525 [Terracidiphilus sp.]